LNKALKWLFAGLVLLVLGKTLTVGAWQGDALWCRQLAAVGAQAGCRLLLISICPGAGWGEAQAAARTAVSPDPSYAVYQKYRYTYQTYVYLFSGEEKTGTGSGKDSYGSAEWWKTMSWEKKTAGNGADGNAASEALGQAAAGNETAAGQTAVRRLVSADQIARLQDYDT